MYTEVIFKAIPLFIIAISVIFESDTLGYDIQHATIATEQNPSGTSEKDGNRYILITTTTAEDDFCKRYLETCPSDDGNIPDTNTNSQPNNDNYALEFERKYAEKDNNNKTVITQQQPLVPGVNINGTFGNETLIVPQQPQQQPTPTPDLPRVTPPTMLPPTL